MHQTEEAQCPGGHAQAPHALPAFYGRFLVPLMDHHGQSEVRDVALMEKVGIDLHGMLESLPKEHPISTGTAEKVRGYQHGVGPGDIQQEQVTPLLWCHLQDDLPCVVMQNESLFSVAK